MVPMGEARLIAGHAHAAGKRHGPGVVHTGESRNHAGSDAGGSPGSVRQRLVPLAARLRDRKAEGPVQRGLSFPGFPAGGASRTCSTASASRCTPLSI